MWTIINLASFKTRLKSISYHFRKIWNSDQLPEQVYQPLGTQDDCATVLDNYPQVMIEIHHGGKFFLIINEALLLGMGSQLRYTQVINWLGLGKQSVDDFLKVQPPSLQTKEKIDSTRLSIHVKYTQYTCAD